MYYNFAAGSFLSKKLYIRLHSIEVDFYSKKRKSSVSEPPFGRFRGNVRTKFIARWKARVRLLIGHNLWSPYGIGQTIYIFMLWFVLSSSSSSSSSFSSPFFFFSSPNLSRRRLDVCHTSTHGVALVRI